MHIVDTIKFTVGIVFLAISLAMLVRSRGTRGFNQSRQASLLFLLGGILFVAIGFGFDVKGLFR